MEKIDLHFPYWKEFIFCQNLDEIKILSDYLSSINFPFNTDKLEYDKNIFVELDMNRFYDKDFLCRTVPLSYFLKIQLLDYKYKTGENIMIKNTLHKDISESWYYSGLLAHNYGNYASNHRISTVLSCTPTGVFINEDSGEFCIPYCWIE